MRIGFKTLAVGTAALVGLGVPCHSTAEGIVSLDTGYTISKIRTAVKAGTPFIVASSYEGSLLGIGYDGTKLWTNALSGFMNRDVWCEDINGDGSDEVLAANADGTLYCLDGMGRLQWKFRPDDAPMNAVCVLHFNQKPYVVCGGYDLNIYYLSPAGALVKTVPSSAYSKEKPWGKNSKEIPKASQHVANLLRPVKRKNGTEVLAVHAAINSNSGRGAIYLMNPLDETAFKVLRLETGGSVGEMRCVDIDGDGNDEILTGASSMIDDAVVLAVDPDDDSQRTFKLATLRKQIDGFGYRVVQPELVQDGGKARILALFGSRIVLLPPDLSPNAKDIEVLASWFSYNEMWKDPKRNLIVLASAQSGGSCVHLLNLDAPRWKADYVALVPPGKITATLKNTAAAREQLKRFQRPVWERPPLPVYFLSDSRSGSGEPSIKAIEAKYPSPIFLNGKHLSRVENVDRTRFDPAYQKKRDQRKQYFLTSDQMVNELLPLFDGAPGISYWGGHGNDPYQTSLQTQQRIFDAARAKANKVVTIYPELEQHDAAFAWVLQNHFYPMADYAKGRDANLFIRTKHAFWNGVVYLPMWRGLISGEYADVFVPALEETTDKTMEISVAARLGLWTSGAVNQWGARCARDNTSFDRLRQHSHQMLPNHFLRQMIYNISCGATYLDNFSVDQDYMSFLWELIAQGALYVPQRNELVSLSPVHLGMLPPDEHFLDTGNNVKWLTFFDAEVEQQNPMVFGRLNGTWPGAPVTEWDFSRYAAGVKERRLNFLPPYEHGIVMIAPPQEGQFADPRAPRGRMADHLHPLYRDIMKEYLTDGRNYVSADGKQTFPAAEYYKTIGADIQAGATKLPLTVSGEVAWVCAQTSPTHLRLTLIDGGYINPSDKTATVTFHTVKPARMTDLLDGTVFEITNPSSVLVNVRCGLFRFIDIELKTPLFP